MTKLDATTIDEIVGKHQTIYDIYFSQADLSGSGIISAIDAGLFLKQSKLSDAILKNIWELVDPTGKGYLDRQTFYISLKLIALAQSNIDVKLENIHMNTNAPKLSDIGSNMISLISPNDHWYIKASSRIQFDKVFESLSPMNNKILGSRVKPYLLQSGLPIDVLGKIWELSDLDQDGQLTRSEFHIAMQLVAKGKEGINIPDQLPPSLLPFKTRHSSIHSHGEVKTWVVTAEEKSKSDALFATLDTDKDGYVNGGEVKDVFLKTGLQQLTLAAIWALSDIYNSGRLNNEQFALAMHFVKKKAENGIEPPMYLTPEMVPPSCRPKHVVEDTKQSQEVEDLQTQVTELQREKLYYEQRAAEHDLLIRQKRTELSTCELEMDSLFKTLRDREINRSEDQKKLNDYEEKINKLNGQLVEVKSIYETEKAEIENIKFQIGNMHTTQLDKENELNKIKNDLQLIRSERASLEMRVSNRKQQLNELKSTNRAYEVEKTSVLDKLNLMKSMQTNLNRLLKEYTYALNNDGKNVDDLRKLEDENVSLKEKIDNSYISPTKSFKSPTGSTTSNHITPSVSQQFNTSNLFNDNAFEAMLTTTTSQQQGQFYQNDPFSSFDPFKDQNDPFTRSSTVSNKIFDDAFATSDFDPFAAEKPFEAKRKLPPPRPAPPRPQTPSLKPVKQPDNTKRPQSALDFTYNKKLDLFSDFDPFSSPPQQQQQNQNTKNWTAFSSNNQQFDPFA